MVARIALAALACAAFGALAAEDRVVGYTAPDGDIVLSDAKGGLLTIGVAAWGPKWAWTGVEGPVRNQDGAAVGSFAGKMGGTGVPFTLAISARASGARQLTVEATLAAERATELTLVVLTLTPGQRYHGADRGRVAEGAAERAIAVPFGKAPLGEAVTALKLQAPGADLALGFSAPTVIRADGVARVVLAEGSLPASEPRRLGFTIDLPAELTWYPTATEVPDDPAFARAFVWKPEEALDAPSAVSLADWLDAPAGKHGRVTREGDRLLAGGKPVRFWGVNNCYGTCAPDKELAVRRAKLYAKHGVNAVRLHKYADGPGWAGIQSAGSFAQLDPAGLERMDYFVAQLKERGIYVKLSPTFGVKLGNDDRAAVPYLEEFGKLDAKDADGRVSTGHGAVFLSTELQDLQIRQTVELLKHRNPHTGMTYAEDPAVLVVELFNEDCALFYGHMGALQKPTLRKRAATAFSEWLAAKYGDEAKLLAAWGPEAIDSFKNEGITGESFAAKTIVPAGNPWFYDPTQLAGSQKAKRARLLDTMRFLYELQNAFYARFVKALRDTGYQGEILASNWQAGRAMSHFYNLHSDWQVGMIDRHNYHGSAVMLDQAGSSILSTGLQQVADRPFSLSEWITVFPGEWGAEGPALIGAYGMGLQGWDISFMFQNRDAGNYADTVGKDQWEITVPHVLGMFPAVARQVLRGDVAQSTVEAPMHVHVPSLLEGKVGVDDRVAQEADVKSLDSEAVPARALAAARCVVRFGDTFKETPRFDLAPYLQDGAVVSSTKQLRWTEATAGKHGWFSIDTPATQAVVGFAEGVVAKLGDTTIAPKSPFAAIYLTAIGREDTLAGGKRVLLTALARSRNTGMKYLGGRMLVKGKAPIVIEPVVATITLKRPGATVYACDHDGRRTAVTVPVADGAFTIDTGEQKTIWYEVVYE